jgi:hypothetical protein
MTVVVDTGVLYAEHDSDATRHEDAAAALETVYSGTLGQPYISDYVYGQEPTPNGVGLSVDSRSGHETWRARTRRSRSASLT